MMPGMARNAPRRLASIATAVENAFAESFNGWLHHECLNINWSMSVKHAREVMESWRQDYNEVGSHSSLKGCRRRSMLKR